MDNALITLKNNGYTIERKVKDGVEAKKDEDKFFIKWFKISTNEELVSQMENLKKANHCHTVNTQNSFKDQDMYYVVMEECQGGTLAKKIRGMSEPLQESETLSLIVELCMALKTFQDNDLLHKDLTPQVVFLTEFGTLRLGGTQASAMAGDTATPEGLNYVAPETLTNTTYDAKSAIWSVGCILYELCTKQQAVRKPDNMTYNSFPKRMEIKMQFSADTTVGLISRITSGPDPVLQDQFSSEFLELFHDMLSRIPDLRPTVHEILRRPIVLRCLLTKCQSTTEHLQGLLDKLNNLADGLERVHVGTTIGSMVGGLAGAVGGITALACIALAPVTLGASLAVAGVEAGAIVGLAGGITAGASNIVKAVNDFLDRKTLRTLIKEFEEKLQALTFWLHEIDNSLQNRQRASRDSEDNDNPEEWVKVGLRVGKGFKDAYQLSRVVQVVGAASAVFSTLFVAVDVFFLVKDVQEMENIKQEKADKKTRSEYMKFIKSIREAAGELQKVLDEFKSIIANIVLE